MHAAWIVSLWGFMSLTNIIEVQAIHTQRPLQFYLIPSKGMVRVLKKPFYTYASGCLLGPSASHGRAWAPTIVVL